MLQVFKHTITESKIACNAYNLYIAPKRQISFFIQNNLILLIKISY